MGHEPWVSALLARLLGARHDDRLTFKKGGAALVDVPGRLAEGGSARLVPAAEGAAEAVRGSWCERPPHVTFTLRAEGTRIRVISARDMHRKERSFYEGQG